MTCKEWVINEKEIEKLDIKIPIYLMLLVRIIEEYIISMVMIIRWAKTICLKYYIVCPSYPAAGN